MLDISSIFATKGDLDHDFVDLGPLKDYRVLYPKED